MLYETSLPSAAPLGCGDSLPYERSGRRRGPPAAAAVASEREPLERHGKSHLLGGYQGMDVYIHVNGPWKK